jgi:hypothetical protein
MAEPVSDVTAFGLEVWPGHGDDFRAYASVSMAFGGQDSGVAFVIREPQI